MAKTIDEVKVLSKDIKQKFCPYKGEHDWQIECIKERCMKFDEATLKCTRT
jgi:hypothetical protein